MRSMVVIVPELTGYASIRQVAVSLPYAAQLIDGVKYMLPGDVKQPEGGTERRRQRAPRTINAHAGPVGAGMRQRRAARPAAETQIRSPTAAPRAGTAWQCPGRGRARSYPRRTLTSAAARITLPAPCARP